MRDYFEIVKAMIAAGWRQERTNGGHWKLRSPCGRAMITYSVTPGDRRAVLNFRSDCRRTCARLGIPSPV